MPSKKPKKKIEPSANPSDDRKLWNAAYEARYKALNAEQKKAVDAIEGPVLVVAGPGSGKTEILGLRVGNILRQSDVRASNILCLTFTDSAAANMRDRLASLIGPEAYRVAIYTFHSFSIELIRRYPEFFYGGAVFTAADPITQIEVLEEIFENLPHDNPLRTVHPEQGFVFLPSARGAIASLKKAGISPSEFKAILVANEKEISQITEALGEAFADRMSMKALDAIKAAAGRLATYAGAQAHLSGQAKDPLPFPYRPLAGVVAESLANAIAEAEERENVKPLSAWKEKYLKKDDSGARVFRDALYDEKLSCLAGIYAEYRTQMYARGFYDFDDMLLDVIYALQNRPTLRYEVQEQFHYILVDEFQDTNDAQMRILSLLTSAQVNEGRPNIMAVGDDDQAVYKFQGAEISNILDFGKLFQDPEIVTMTGNYRSTQGILDVARAVILKGEDRLENRMKNMDKSLKALGTYDGSKAGNKAGEREQVIHREFPTQAHEYTWVSKEIKKLIKNGINADTISVITRKHAELESLVPYLRSAGVPIRYEREQNVFEEPHIRELIVMARYLSLSLAGDSETADSFLPQILSFPFWGIEREHIWEVSVKARKENIPWLDAMKESKDRHVKAARDFLIEASAAALYEPLEKALDRMIGAHVPLARESEDEDEEEFQAEHVAPKGISPFREFYFSRENFKGKRAEYLGFLSSLRVFVSALREFRQGEPLGIKDLVEFVEIHEKNNIDLHDKSPFASASDAVTLMTAHKAKGLEFETVFVLSCQEDVWSPRGRGSYLPFPANLPIAPAGDNPDDRLRLFYVALTRARRHLYLTSYETDEKGNASARVSFLHGVLEDEAESEAAGDPKKPRITAENDIPDVGDVLTAEWQSYHTPPFFGEERALLASLLTDYKMSVTHLNNFLNVMKGGPQCFLEQNLLRFPQAKTVSASYGSVVHRVIERIYTYQRMEGRLPETETVVEWFEHGLKKERLAPADYAATLARGKKSIAAFYDAKKDTFKATHRIEVDFKNQGVSLGDDICLNGKIDKMCVSGGDDAEGAKTIEVHDFKTGKPKPTWDGGTDYEKVQLREYARQLHFYKILVEGSRDFSDYTVNLGVLEFVEPFGKAAEHTLIDLPLPLAGAEADAVTERTKALARIVYKKIMDLDFPDVSKYEENAKGVEAFEEDLLAGHI